MEDFGREVIPASLKKHKVFAYFFDGYWEDIGNIRSFFDTHMDLTESLPRFNFYDEKKPFFTRPRYLPSTKIINCHINHSIIADGAIILGSTIENTCIGVRSFVDTGTYIQRSIIMGNTHYESLEERIKNYKDNKPSLGIGRNTVIRNSIVDMDVSIGHSVQLVNREQINETFQEDYAIRDGIIIIPKGAVIPDNTII